MTSAAMQAPDTTAVMVEKSMGKPEIAREKCGNFMGNPRGNAGLLKWMEKATYTQCQWLGFFRQAIFESDNLLDWRAPNPNGLGVSPGKL